MNLIAACQFRYWIWKIRYGSVNDATEASRRLVGFKHPFRFNLLIDIMRNKDNEKWSRISAIYVLGLRGDSSVAYELADMLADPFEKDVIIMDYIAVALGNIGDSSTMSLLENISLMTKSSMVFNTCAYTLHKIRRKSENWNDIV